MIRRDYVSNSSSSSFIVSSEDNKYLILLQNPTILSLKDYVKEFAWRDIFEYSYFKNDAKIKFVTPQAFSKMFNNTIRNTLPNTAKEFHEEYISIYNSKNDKIKWDSPEYQLWSDKLSVLRDKILDAVYDALKLKWDSVEFHYEEIDDNFLDYYEENSSEDNGLVKKYHYENCDSWEDFITSRIEYMNSIKPLKFWRTFSNH